MGDLLTSGRLIKRDADNQAAAVENVRVDHRGLDILVLEQLLDGADAIMVLQEVRGEAVAQGVGADELDDAGLSRCLADRLLQPAFVLTG